MESLFQDIRFAFRALRKTPGFTLIAVVVLALGIGANTAIFSIADAFLLRPLPFHDLDRLVVALELRPHETMDTNSIAPATFLDWQHRAQSFESMGAFDWNDQSLTGAGVPQKVQGVAVTSNYFDILEARPVLGRGFQPGEDQPGRDQEVVLSHGLWVRQFAGDSAVLGRQIRLDGQTYTVIGVMGKEFDFPKPAELWTPMAFDEKDRADRARRYVIPVGRLKKGVTVAQAQSEMNRIAAEIGARFPETNRGWNVRVIPMGTFAIGDLTEQFTLLLLGAVGFVLLIVCANVANLQFARGAGREREVALRLALGAGRSRVVRLLLTESVVLALAGTIPGLAMAWWSIRLIVGAMPPEVAKYIAGWEQISLDSRAIAFTVGVAALAGIVAGLMPALKSSRPNLEESLREGARGASGGRSSGRLRNVLVVAQVSLALILMVGAGLMVRGFNNLMGVNAHLEPERILTMHLNLPDSDRYKTPQQMVAFYDAAQRELGSIPQVQATAFMTNAPFSQNYSARAVDIEGRDLANDAAKPTALYQVVNPEFFQMMGVPLREGRLFDARDSLDTLPVVVISENLARRYWPGESAIGKRIRGGRPGDNPWLTIVGVTGEVKYEWIKSAPEQAFYRPYSQAARHFSSIALRVASGDPMQLADTVRRRIAAIDPDLPLYDMKTHARLIYESTIGLAYPAVMLAVIGAMGLLLSAVGVYGVMAYAVADRTREFGIRMALGAPPADVLRLVLRRGAALTLTGLAVGLPGAYALAQLLAGVLFGINAGDATTFAGVPLLLTAVAALACYVPARRAARVDPLVALRYE